jgi:hypothetical protein
MQSINKSERRNAFWKFLMLFLVSIILITTTIFFSINVPFKQNDQLRREMSVVEKEQLFSEKFTNEMLEITAMLDSINTKAANPELLESVITEKINKLNIMVEIDSIRSKKLYRNIVLTLSDLKVAKNQLRQNTGSVQSNSDLQNQKDDLERKLEAKENLIVTLQAQLDMFRKSQ